MDGLIDGWMDGSIDRGRERERERETKLTIQSFSIGALTIVSPCNVRFASGASTAGIG